MAAERSDARLPVTSRGVMRLTPRLRETYLDPSVEDGECITQAVGDTVRVWIWSDRQNLRLEVPLSDFMVRRPYRQSIHRWGISISRYLDADDTTGGPSIVVSDGEKPTVEVSVDTFDAEVMPDV